MPSKTQVKNHLLYIDGIRAVAAIYVVMHHAVLQYKWAVGKATGFHLSLIQNVIVRVFYYGHYFVDLFIVISGFSLMLSVTKNGYLKGGNFLFFKRRVLRILPPYYFAMAFSLLLIWLLVGKKTDTLWDISIPPNLTDVVKHTFLVHDFFRSSYYKISHPFWSIAVEFRIYLFFPLMVWIWKKSGAGWTLIFAGLVSVAGSLLLLYYKQSYPDVSTEGAGVSPYIILFALGMLAADLAFSNNQAAGKLRRYYMQISTWVVGAAIMVFFFASEVIRHYLTINNVYIKELEFPAKIFDVTIGFFFAFVLFSCSIPLRTPYNFWLLKILSWPPLVFVGTFSYSLYLIHAPLLFCIYQYILVPLQLNKFTSCMLLLTGGTAITIVIAYFFFYFFERPFLTLGKKLNIAVER